MLWNGLEKEQRNREEKRNRETERNRKYNIF